MKCFPVGCAIPLERLQSEDLTQAQSAVLSLPVSAEECRLSEVLWHDELSKDFWHLKQSHHTGTPTLPLCGSACSNKLPTLSALHFSASVEEIPTHRILVEVNSDEVRRASGNVWHGGGCRRGATSIFI